MPVPPATRPLSAAPPLPPAPHRAPSPPPVVRPSHLRPTGLPTRHLAISPTHADEFIHPRNATRGKGKGQHREVSSAGEDENEDEVESEEETAIKEPDLVAATLTPLHLRQLELRLHLLLRYPLLPPPASPSPATSLITFSSSPLMLFANASYLGPASVIRSF